LAIPPAQAAPIAPRRRHEPGRRAGRLILETGARFGARRSLLSRRRVPGMADDTLLNELVSLWEQRRREGAPASPAELCAGHPELVGALRRQAEGLAPM